MKAIKSLSVLLATAIATLSLPLYVHSLSSPVGAITNETSRTTKSITLSNGTDTGVRYTEINISGSAYGTGKVLRLAECDLSNTNLSIDVINCGSSIVKTQTIAAASKSFSNNGKTVLAALNGDLWMTGVNSNSNVTKKTLQTTRGIMIVDGEVWATQEFGMENYMNTSNAGTTASLKSAFGVTDENQPLVGAPVFTLTLTNETKNVSVAADGLNRLPAWDSLVVYNHRVNSANYALNDSYEIELVADSTAFTLKNKISATVKAVYPSGSTVRPSIDENTIIITARGSRMSDLSSVYAVGDKVSFDLTLTDKFGRTEHWQNVVDAIGGHMQVIKDDERASFDTSASEYPTSLIGIKDDGTVMFANMNSASNGTYRGLRFKDAYQLCRELGYNSVFYLDGGGSSAIVTLENGTYTQRNYSADGTPRAVINGVAMVWNDTPVCKKQGSLAYITTEEEFSTLSPTFIPAGVLTKINSGTNDLDTDYLTDEGLFRLNVSKSSIDPYINFKMSKFSERIDTAYYKYITVKLKTNIAVQSQFALYFFTDAQESIQNITKSVLPAPGDIYVTFNMSTVPGWSGKLTDLRLDIFEGITSTPGQRVDIEYIAFSRTPREVSLLTGASYPLGAIKDYYAFKDCDGNHSYTIFTSNDSETHNKECDKCGYSVSESHKKTTKAITNPTCTSEGTVVFACSGCDTTMEILTIPTVGHTFSDQFTVDIEPTPKKEGQKSRHCKYCNEVTDITAIPPTGINGDINGDGALNSLDTNVLARYLAGLSPNIAEDPDINGDGKVNSMDSQMLKRLILGVA